MVKICQKGVIKFTFEIIQKTHFPVLPKILQSMDEVKHFFANFQILVSLGYQAQKCEKIQKSLHPNLYTCHKGYFLHAG
jgi:hypothetical protein